MNVAQTETNHNLQNKNFDSFSSVNRFFLMHSFLFLIFCLTNFIVNLLTKKKKQIFHLIVSINDNCITLPNQMTNGKLKNVISDSTHTLFTDLNSFTEKYPIFLRFLKPVAV